MDSCGTPLRKSLNLLFWLIYVFFYLFIKKPDILERWIKALRREKCKPTKSLSELCSEYFLPSDFLERPECTKKVLKPDSVPIIFQFPNRLEKKVVLPRRKLIKIVNICSNLIIHII